MELEHVVSVTDDRKRSRLACNATVQVATVDNRIIHGQLRDIGLHSLYLFTDNENDDFLIYGETVRVKVAMRRGESHLTVEIDGNIARMDDLGFVILFRQALRWWPVFTMFPSSENH